MIVDLHCDTLTSDKKFEGQVRLDELRKLCAFQCFAVFIPDSDAAAYAAARNLFCRTFPCEGIAVVRRFKDIATAQKSGKACAALTCENIGFTDGNYNNVLRLKADGVIMASLVWNEGNALAYPNVRVDGKREARGLKDKGRQAIEALDDYKIIVDISHLSDGGAEEILKGRKIPVVASHSNCDSLCPNPRNLTDEQLKKIADCGGVVGVNFYKKFLGGEGDFAEIAAHIKHIIEVAGEDTPAFGSDWDGVPSGGIPVCPRNMPELLNYLCNSGLPPRVVEKIAKDNFLRVFKEVG